LYFHRHKPVALRDQQIDLMPCTVAPEIQLGNRNTQRQAQRGGKGGSIQRSYNLNVETSNCMARKKGGREKWFFSLAPLPSCELNGEGGLMIFLGIVVCPQYSRRWACFKRRNYQGQQWAQTKRWTKVPV